MDRRSLMAAAGIAAIGQLQMRGAMAASSVAKWNVLDAFIALPGRKSALIEIDRSGEPWRISHDPDAALFCGSCFKTFVLATYLQAVEAGKLSEAEQLRIDDDVRSTGGGVFEFLTGTTSARVVLEAMIAHSDNTATDVAMKRVGVENVRAFIKKAGLASARIPDSTRRFFSYVSGYPVGTDMGWAGIEKMKVGTTPGTRPSINDTQAMVCSARDFVSYYKRALAGEFFRKPETLTEFRRIQAMADSIAVAIPPNTPAYMKGGSIDWDGFHCMASAGQMIVRERPVTFSMTVNWTDKDGSQEKIVAAYIKSVAEAMTRIRDELLKTQS